MVQAWELWRASKGTGKEPREALRSLSALAFNMTVMHAHDRVREMRWGIRVESQEDPFAAVIAALRLIYEEL